MGQKGHIMVQKGLKMHKKRQKIEFLDLKRRFFSLAELGGTPTPPLTENQCEKKKVFFLSGKGGYPHPPLNGRIPLKRFLQVPLHKGVKKQSKVVLFVLLFISLLSRKHRSIELISWQLTKSPPTSQPCRAP